MQLLPLGTHSLYNLVCTLGQRQISHDMSVLPPSLGNPPAAQTHGSETAWPDLPFCAAHCLRGLGQLLNRMGVSFLTYKMGHQLSGAAVAEKQRTVIGELSCVCVVLG